MLLQNFKSWWLLYFGLLSILTICGADNKFTLQSRWPLSKGQDQGEVVWQLKAGAKTVLKCTSSEKFQLVKINIDLFCYFI
jgi:hypothetical protein